MAALSFLSNIKVSAPLPTDWKYRVQARTELISILSQPTNYPYQGQLAVVVNDTINDGLYLLQTVPDLRQANSGLTIDNWIKLEIKTYLGVAADTKPVLETYHAGVMFYEVDTVVLSIWDGVQWNILISGASGDNFVEYDKFVDLPEPGVSNILYVVLHNELGNDLNAMYRWDTLHDNGDGTFGRYELMSGGGGSGDGAMVNPVTSELPEHVGGIAPQQIVPAGTDLEAFVTLLLNPLVIPTKTNNSLSIGAISGTTREVGTPIMATLTYTYSEGLIHSKNGTVDIPLTGAEVSHLFRGIGIDESTGVISSNMFPGVNNWDVDVDFIEGTGDYFDSEGDESCIFNAVTHICPGDDSRAAGTLTATSTTLNGIYPFLYGGDVTDLSSGAGVYNLIKKIETKANKTYSISIAGTAAYIYFSYPATYGDLSVILDGNGFNVTESFTKHVNNVTSVITGGTNWTRSYNIYKTNAKTFVDPAQDYQFKF